MHPSETAIHDYVDDTLSAFDRAEVERHLSGCADCRALVDDLREIRRATRSLELREPPVRAWTRIERAIQLEAQHAPRVNRSRAMWLGLAAAAVL